MQFLRNANLNFLKSGMAFSVLLSLVALARTLPNQTVSAAPVPEAIKVGLVNIQAAVANTNEGKKEFAALEERFASKRAEIKTQNDELGNLKKQLADTTITEEQRKTIQSSINTKQSALQHNVSAAQNEYQKAEQEIMQRLGPKMLSVLEKYSKANGFAVILDVSTPNNPVLWGDASVNIAPGLVEAYNAESAAPSTNPAPAKP
ncbi:MAG: OmpH family outer membrane protein [Candidatus Acidiferrales bacterium]